MHSNLGIEIRLSGRYHPPQSKDLRGDTAEFSRPQKTGLAPSVGSNYPPNKNWRTQIDKGSGSRTSSRLVIYILSILLASKQEAKRGTQHLADLPYFPHWAG